MLFLIVRRPPSVPVAVLRRPRSADAYEPTLFLVAQEPHTWWSDVFDGRTVCFRERSIFGKDELDAVEQSRYSLPDALRVDVIVYQMSVEIAECIAVFPADNQFMLFEIFERFDGGCCFCVLQRPIDLHAAKARVVVFVSQLRQSRV